MLLPIIMAGGSGTRLWPLSRQNYPKQFLNLTGQGSMLQKTLERIDELSHLPPQVICNEEHRFLAAEQLRQIDIEHQKILLEPVGRNTAPAIALAAFDALHKYQDAVLLVLAADHDIQNIRAFHKAVLEAKEHAEKDQLVTFGVVPGHPETGYGYIQQGEEFDRSGKAYHVAAFVEKPDYQTAEDYIRSGNYLWNSGMFMFKASVYLSELQRYRPDIYLACEQASKIQTPDLDFIRIDKAAFEACPSESIDYAVMEHTDRAVVVSLDAQWSDVGGFAALRDIQPKDKGGNVVKGDVKVLNSRDCMLYSEDKLLAAIGVENLIVINTKDATLVVNGDCTQDVKQLVEQLKLDERSEANLHREVYRPWGKYDSVDAGERFQVKRITVKPGAKLSVQMHHHRAEHWIVVSGTAKVTNGDQQLMLTENESTYIPIGVVHALENPGKVDLELIEVQSGSYLGEDDIVRFEDLYGRVEQ